STENALPVSFMIVLEPEWRGTLRLPDGNEIRTNGGFLQHKTERVGTVWAEMLHTPSQEQKTVCRTQLLARLEQDNPQVKAMWEAQDCSSSDTTYVIVFAIL